MSLTILEFHYRMEQPRVPLRTLWGILVNNLQTLLLTVLAQDARDPHEARPAVRTKTQSLISLFESSLATKTQFLGGTAAASRMRTVGLPLIKRRLTFVHLLNTKCLPKTTISNSGLLLPS